LTGLHIHFEFATANSNPRLQPLVDLLNGIKRTADEPQLWDDVTTKVAAALGKGRCRVEAAILSPDGQHLAVCSEVRTLLGFRVHQAGLVYAIGEHSIVGRAALGRRTSEGWSGAKS
jgi:WD40 repeat protein